MKRFISIIISLLIISLSGITICAEYYGASSWAVKSLDSAEEYGLIIDRIKKNMSASVTREEFAELAVRMCEVYTGKTPSAGSISFTDTNNIQILKAANAGFVSGTGNGKFSPKDTLTREQMATILYKTIKVISPWNNFISKKAYDFSDSRSISSWAKEAVNTCTGMEIMTGVGNNRFDPKGTATREQAVISCKKAYELLRYTVEVYVNGEKVKMGDIEMIYDTPFADPLPILKKIGAEYGWDDSENTLSAYYGSEGIAFEDGNKYANHNNKAIELPFYPYVKQDSLFVPLVPMFEAFGLTVDWNYSQAYLLIETKDYNTGQNQNTTTTYSAQDITGLWSTNKTTGVKVDSYGNITDFTYTGDWFYFGKDNTFRYTIIFNQEAAFISGEYKIEEGKINVTNAYEGYYPGKGSKRDNKTYTFSFENYDNILTLILKDDNGFDYKCYKSSNN